MRMSEIATHERRACWTCSVCGYDMAQLYGELGEGMVHVHHLRDLASLGEEYEVNPIKDLRPVCPNCHAILHATSPVKSIDDLRKILAARKPIPWPASSVHPGRRGVPARGLGDVPRQATAVTDDEQGLI